MFRGGTATHESHKDRDRIANFFRGVGAWNTTAMSARE